MTCQCCVYMSWIFSSK